MSYINQIDAASYIMIENIKDSGGNDFEFELLLGRVSTHEEYVQIGESKIGPAKQIIFDELSPAFRITFARYIAFSVIDESYGDGDDFAYSGINIRKYTESFFLQYVRQDTFATDNYPGKFIHYRFLSENHIINVASTEEPIIEKLV